MGVMGGGSDRMRRPSQLKPSNHLKMHTTTLRYDVIKQAGSERAVKTLLESIESLGQVH